MTLHILKLKAVKTEEDHCWAVGRIKQLMAAEPESPEEAELEILTVLVDAYETQTYPNTGLKPVEAIKFRAEQMNLKEEVLVALFGSKEMMQRVLEEKQVLSADMILTLNRQLGIPIESLVTTPQSAAGR